MKIPDSLYSYTRLQQIGSSQPEARRTLDPTDEVAVTMGAPLSSEA
jgi:hypothetical protein